MKSKNIINYLIICLVIFSGLLTSCTEKDEDLQPAPRLFRPMFSDVQIGDKQNWIKVYWKKINGANKYTIDLSLDTFKTIYRTAQADTSEYLFDNLEWDKTYQIRIKCEGDNISSMYYEELNLKVSDYPTLLKDIPQTDIIDNAIIVRWTNDNTPFTGLKVIRTSDSLTVDVPLNANDLTNSFKQINNLDPATSYIVSVYTNDTYRGKKKFVTAAAQQFAIPVDLRGIDDATAKTMITTSYLAGLESGTTLILKPGMHYSISGGTNFSKNVTFVTGLGFGATPAVFDMASAFNIAVSSSIDSLKFVGVNFIGTNPAAGFAGNFGGYYFCNINTACTINKLIVDNCVFKYLRGVIRLQGGPVISNLSYNNCVIDSIAGYGVANIDNATAAMENISVTNSTISNVMYFIRSTRNPSVKTKTIKVEDCTFYHAPQSPNYFLDISGTTTITDGVTVKSCIFGPGMNSTATPTTTNIAGFRAANIPILTTSGSFKTSDMSWTVDTAIPDVAEYSGTSATLFKNPGAGDFTINDNSFIGKSSAGDPRWRK